MAFNLLDDTKKVDKPEEEIFRATYRRRGSEIYIAATKSSKVLVTRFKTRANSYEYWLHNADDIEANNVDIKAWLEAEKYTKVSAMPTGGQVANG